MVGWGYTHPAPPTLTNAVALAAGQVFIGDNFALTRQGTVISWPGHFSRPLSLPSGLTNITAIAKGFYHTLALRADGTVFGWGSDQFGESTGIPSTNFMESARGQVVLNGEPLHDVVALAAGLNFSVALKRDGTLVAWGGEIATSPAFQDYKKLTNIVAVTAGDLYVVALQRLTE